MSLIPVVLPEERKCENCVHDRGSWAEDCDCCCGVPPDAWEESPYHLRDRTEKSITAERERAVVAEAREAQHEALITFAWNAIKNIRYPETDHIRESGDFTQACEDAVAQYQHEVRERKKAEEECAQEKRISQRSRDRLEDIIGDIRMRRETDEPARSDFAEIAALRIRALKAEARVRELERGRRPVGVDPPVVTGSAVGEVDDGGDHKTLLAGMRCGIRFKAD